MPTSPEQPLRGFLVIEDDVDTGYLIAEVLRTHLKTTSVRIVRNIGDAVRLDTAQFDLVLCDYNLPDGTALDALLRLRERNPDVAVVIVTGETEIETAVAAVRAGAFDYVVKAGQFLSLLPLTVEKNLALHRMKRENTRLQQELEAALGQTRDANAKLENLVAQLEHFAMTDALTGLANRRHLNDALVRMASASVRQESDVACIMIDLDGFKSLNDTLGHQRGDELLALVGRLIAANSRTADLPARYGGDEFAILLPQTDLKTAIFVAQRLFEEFHRHTPLHELCSGSAGVTLSIGAASRRFSRDDRPDLLLAQADEALYAAKTRGRNRLMARHLDGRILPGEAAA